MGIPEDYNDNDYKEAYENTVRALSAASASPQECVEGGQKDESQLCHVEARKPLIQIVQGRRWSPGVYRALRQRGKTLEVAWRRAFL